MKEEFEGSLAKTQKEEAEAQQRFEELIAEKKDNENKKEETTAATPKAAEAEAAAAESSDWDVYISAEHQRKYWHNRKTGETRWTCPDEVVEADLELGAAEYAMHISP